MPAAPTNVAPPQALSQKSASIVSLDNSAPRTAVPPANNRPPENPDLEMPVDNMEVEIPKEKKNETTPVTPAESTPKNGEAKPDADPANEVSFELPEPTKTHAQPAIPEGRRNYEEYPQNLVPVLKLLNNAQFAKHAPELRKLHEQASKVADLEAKLAAKPKVAEFFYEQPEAYVLDPNYKRIEQDRYYAELEQHVLNKALLAIKRGEAWECPTGYDANGKLQTKKIEPLPNGVVDAENEIAVNNALMQVNAAMLRHEQALQQFKGSYATQSTKVQEELSEIRAKIFPRLADETKFSAEDKKYADFATSSLPKVFTNHPLMPILRSMAAASGQFLTQRMKDLAEIERLKAALENRAVAGPTVVANGGGTSASGDDKEIKFDSTYPT